MTRTLIEVDSHSYCPDFLIGGPVLDVGARGFIYSRHFAGKGHRVIALDPSPDVEDPKEPNLEYMRLALVGVEGKRELVMHENHDGRFIKSPGEASELTKYPVVEVEGVNISTLSTRCNVPQWDLVKINCEGEEYEILPRWPGPIARQMVVSFHEHWRPAGNAKISAIVEYLKQWYTPVKHLVEFKHYGHNFWDSVFALKEIA